MTGVASPPARRVLVAEDTGTLRQVLLRALGILGFEADGVASANELTRRLEGYLPDAVLLDWNLEDGDAGGVLEDLQELGIPVLVVTGDPDSVPVCGVPVLGKPIRLEELRRRMEELCRSR